MPNLPSHIDLALQASKRLGWSELDDHVGYFAMGSTCPDIRAVTRQPRSESHFTDLDFEAVGTGVAGLFHAHPQLSGPAGKNGPTRAFLAGYLTHLIMDEAYVIHVYRPYFGNRDLIADPVAANMLDRALQIYIDKDIWESTQQVLRDMEYDAEAVDLPFLETDALKQWEEWVFRLVDRGFTFERLRNMTRRMVGDGDPQSADSFVAEFLRDIPASEQQLRVLVPDEVVACFKSSAVDSMVESIDEYLS
ncbi:MAG: zinc dependent phospholipase C family protein [SAR202 cluster bacterium]|nr:zinc dependent phospholipase C family protein [SAR202 cluster bacterium]MDP7104743.1 zinc dependent phospholipase C family protein [SAR202 cluster bacterium]MDP7413412.1 zinc dependent phospholipase C family protein [SAR202 cluster bacterium]MDP7534984.1 zinc dependent phospholipase C family protein [SAR202 cluster bacterium]HJO81672.1 zinc dependent phospholipase C family protein [SAR202 cluster bacterium]